jgi:hypothetical protein
MRGAVLHNWLRRFQISAMATVLAMALGAVGATTASAKSAAMLLHASVNPNTGVYSIRSTSPAWNFSGTLPAPLQAMHRTTGKDPLGAYRQIRFSWLLHGKLMTAAIRTYRAKPAAQFILTFNQATKHPQIPFPDFTTEPRGLHILSYQNQPFAPPQFSAGQSGTPWLLFDRHDHAALISPAKHFTIMTMRGNGITHTMIRLNRQVAAVPAKFQIRSLMVITHGINHAYDVWGPALTTLGGKTRLGNEAAPVLRYLGYWTDNGATYYYHFNKKLGYAGTVLAETRHLLSRHIPIHYLELDSWWYRKDSTNYRGGKARSMLPEYQHQDWDKFGGITHYTASRHLFPKGLKAFDRQAGLPLVVHGRWISQKSPYHQRYNIIGIAPVDSRYWNHIASYLHASGVETYLQDWQSVIARYSDFFSNLTAGHNFYHNMAAGMAAHGLTVMYCMPLPCELLESSTVNNVIATRVNNDIFIRPRFYDCLFTSRLAGALGLRPWDDVCMSWRTDNVLLQNLSAGVVGFGDPIGKENRTNLMRTCRSDGVIIKPDVPVVPIDRAYLNGALHIHAPVIARTYTNQDGVKTVYVFAFAPRPGDKGPVTFSAADIGLHGAMYVYNYFTGASAYVPAGQHFAGALGADNASYYVCASPGDAGIALMGQRGKFVGTGRARIPSLANLPGALMASVAFAPGEDVVTLHGFAAFKPVVTVHGGIAGAVLYNAATRHFIVRVSPSITAPLRELDGSVVKEINVVFTH